MGKRVGAESKLIQSETSSYSAAAAAARNNNLHWSEQKNKRRCNLVMMSEMIESSSNAPINIGQDPNECLEIMHAPVLSSSSDSCSNQFEFDPYRDKPISTHTTASRSIVHQNGLWHNSVHIWIVSPSSSSASQCSTSTSSATADILLQKRSSTKDTFPNRYDISCAGHVSSATHIKNNAIDTSTNNENSLLETLRAELSEELGWVDGVHVNVALELSKPAFIIPAQQSHLGGCNAFEHVYFLVRCRDVGTDDVKEDDDKKTNDCRNTNNDHTTLKSVGQFSLGSAEVSEVLWRPVHEVLDALRSGDENYAPRTREYVDAMEKELDRILIGRSGTGVVGA